MVANIKGDMEKEVVYRLHEEEEVWGYMGYVWNEKGKHQKVKVVV